jgi:hypothetical protein
MSENRPRSSQVKAHEDLDDRMAEVIRAKSPAERLAMVDAMWRSATTMIRLQVARAHPEWPVSRVQEETARRLSHGAF